MTVLLWAVLKGVFYDLHKSNTYMERMEKSMSKVAVVYWSGHGRSAFQRNTLAMATAVAEDAQEKGTEVSLIFCGELMQGGWMSLMR